MPRITSRFLFGLLGVWIICACIFNARVGGQVDARKSDDLALFAKCWDYTTSPDLSVGVAADALNAYFLTVENKIEAVDLKTASKLWSSELGGEVASNLMVTDAAIFLITSTGEGNIRKSRLRSVSKQTGIPNWSADVATSPRYSLGVAAGNVIAVGVDGNIVAYSREKGEMIWTKRLTPVTTDPQFTNTDAILGTDRLEIVSVAGSDGQVVTISKAEYLPTSVFLDDERRLVIGDERGNLVLRSADADTIWKFRNGARIGFVLPYDSEYLAVSNDNFIYKINRGGNVEWKRRLPGRIALVAELVGKVGLASVIGDGSVYVINLRNGKIINRIVSLEENAPRIAVHAKGTGFVVARGSGLVYYTPTSCVPTNEKTVRNPHRLQKKS